MKLRSLILATVVLLALAATLYWSDHRKPAAEASKPSDASPAILKLDEATITKVELKRNGAESLVLTKGNTGAWRITEPQPFAADQNNVSSTLSSLSSLNSERVVDDKPADLKQYGLAAPTVEVDITEKDNKSHKLLLGDDTPTGSAVYAMLQGDPRVFTIASYNRNTIAKSLDDLRDKRLLPVNADQVSRVEITRKNQTIEFGRNKEEWQILQPKPLRSDSAQVDELVRKLADARMNLKGSDPASKEAASAFAAAIPVATAKLTDPSGTQGLQIRKNKDIYYARTTAVDGVYKVNSDVASALDRGLDDFRYKKIFDFGFADPNKIEMHSGSKAYFLTRTGSDWWSNGKKMDVDGVGLLISNLRDLSADKFVDSGFATPTMDATVTTDDGKRIEKISIAKSDSGYIARRENEPTLYHLDSSVVDALQKSADDLKPAAAPAK
jgi:Domain of unknown function (DUF4340)